MNDVLIQYSYVERDENTGASKTVSVQLRETDTDSIISGFIDFCGSIGVELKMDYSVAPSESTH